MKLKLRKDVLLLKFHALFVQSSYKLQAVCNDNINVILQVGLSGFAASIYCFCISVVALNHFLHLLGCPNPQVRQPDYMCLFPQRKWEQESIKDPPRHDSAITIGPPGLCIYQIVKQNPVIILQTCLMLSLRGKVLLYEEWLMKRKWMV